ncbi:MAG: imidazole glycerol phosphate synthase subunit HisH [Oscillospiraceae bacterium]|jgi:glutamine amidotransferase|nr:imidazole glycerol phosphate synthase subunit HisH [Oscillospiraceae bacterium]
MIAIIDYGVGNLFSLRSSFEYIGETAVVTRDAAEIKNADRVILPGVGAFEDAARKLAETGMRDAVLAEAASGKPLLGICLGMQMLFERSFEYGEHAGLSLVSGDVAPIEPVIPKGFKIPHIGWNALKFPDGKPKSPLFKYTSAGDHVYFVHSFAGMRSGSAAVAEDAIATTDYGAELTAAVQRGNVYGTQFHPEKSGEVGLNILRAFCEVI